MPKRGRRGNIVSSEEEEPNNLNTAVTFSEGEDSEGEDLFENMGEDYRPIADLDTYDREGLANESEEEEEMTYEQRAAAEQEMDARDRGIIGSRWQGRHIDDEMDLEEENEAGETAARGRLEGTVPQRAAISEMDPHMVHEALMGDSARETIISIFMQFLRTFTRNPEDGTVGTSGSLGSGELVYMEAIRSMCAHNEQSFEVFYSDLAIFDEFTSRITEFLTDHPDVVLPILNEGAKRVVLSEFPSYEEVHSEIVIRIRDFAVLESLRDLRSSSLGKLVRTQGVVTRRTAVFPQMLYLAFRCSYCNHVMEGIRQSSEKEVKPVMCVYCQRKGGLQLATENTVFRNFQKLTLQESPGSVEAGRIPRSKEVILTSDLMDVARPGDEVDVVGIFTNNFDMALNQSNGFPVFSTVIEANNVSLLKDGIGGTMLSHDDEHTIRQLAADPLFEQRFLQSIAPSIFGHADVKMAIALSLFGGQEKIETKHRIRGDINVLLLGDPGTAKSQFLKYAERTSPRAVYTTGKGASAVGLTASVHRDAMTKEWTLEGGALVLADRGVCCIDEFDKMNDADRVSIHEAMEQQSISISKAGIVTTLQARCAVIAAANPKFGRYDPTRSFSENIDLTDPIIQRFDILCVLQDRIDPVEDERLARFVVKSHVSCHPLMMEKRMEEESTLGAGEPTEASLDDPSIQLIPQSLLKKYIQYARNNVHPIIDNVDQDKIATIYAEIRRESVSAGGIPVAIRHIESIIRMAEAHARMHLRDHVIDADVDVAISTLLDSFINSQKHAVKMALRRTFRKYLVRPEDSFTVIMFQLKELVKEQLEADAILENQSMEDDIVFRVSLRELEESVRRMGVEDVMPFLESTMFKDNRFTYDRQTRMITRVFAHNAD